MKQQGISQAQIRWLVGTLHVSSTNRQIMREFWNRLVKTPSNMTPDKREIRKQVYRIALAAHKENQDLVREFRL